VGTIDSVAFGFTLARSERLLIQADGERVGALRLVFTEQSARGVGVGEVMRDTVVGALRQTGHSLFDAHVLPGHRAAKNFFEAGGFSARSIVMHHDDTAG
jgi:GNAT superfamily N-acetyltransferase